MAEVNSRVELEEVLALGVDRAASLLEAEVAVMTFKADTGWIVASGFPGETSYRESLPDGTPETLLRGNGEAILSDLREEHWSEAVRAWAARHRLGPYLGVPLRSAGAQMGVLGVMRLMDGPSFSDQDVVLAQLVASPLAAAIHVAQLFEETRAGSRRREALLASTDLLWRIAPVVEVAASVVKQAVEMMPGTECLLSMVPPERPSHFRIIAGCGGWAEGLVGRQWPWLGTIAGSAMSESRTIESTRLQAESAFATPSPKETSTPGG